MTVVWSCPECLRPVHLHLDVTTARQPDGSWSVEVDASQHVNAHLRSHRRGPA